MTPDSSAIIAASAPWHDRHDAALAALADVTDLIAQAELEAYSVLTRLPPPFRLSAAVASRYLAEEFPGARLFPAEPARRALVPRLAQLGVTGGRVHDALIAATAAEHGLTLLSCDERAQLVYRQLGVSVELVPAAR